MKRKHTCGDRLKIKYIVQWTVNKAVYIYITIVSINLAHVDLITVFKAEWYPYKPDHRYPYKPDHWYLSRRHKVVFAA